MDIIKELYRLPHYIYRIDIPPKWLILGGFAYKKGIYGGETTIPDLIDYHERFTELFQNEELSDEDKKQASGLQEKIKSRCFENCIKDSFTQKQQDELIQQLPQKEKDIIEKQIKMYKQARNYYNEYY